MSSHKLKIETGRWRRILKEGPPAYLWRNPDSGAHVYKLNYPLCPQTSELRATKLDLNFTPVQRLFSVPNVDKMSLYQPTTWDRVPGPYPRGWGLGVCNPPPPGAREKYIFCKLNTPQKGVALE